MSSIESNYVPEKVWKWEQIDSGNGGPFAKINRPIAGPTHEKELPVGKHPLQLYSLGTPNGQKVTILLEELLGLGIKEAEYDAWLIKFFEGEQFGSGFVKLNPNSKIPALMDRSDPSKPIRVFESGSILLYLAEKFGEFLPKDIAGRTEAISWLFWQVGSSPFIGGGFGHFFKYAPEKIKDAIDRYTMEAKRQLSVLDNRLKEVPYIAGQEYTIADIGVYTWYFQLLEGVLFDAPSVEFLAVHEYPNLKAWGDRISQRPAVQRGLRVNKPQTGLPERHSASDFDA